MVTLQLVSELGDDCSVEDLDGGRWVGRVGRLVRGASGVGRGWEHMVGETGWLGMEWGLCVDGFY